MPSFELLRVPLLWGGWSQRCGVISGENFTSRYQICFPFGEMNLPLLVEFVLCTGDLRKAWLVDYFPGRIKPLSLGGEKLLWCNSFFLKFSKSSGEFGEFSKTAFEVSFVEAWSKINFCELFIFLRRFRKLLKVLMKLSFEKASSFGKLILHRLFASWLVLNYTTHWK